MAVKLSGMAANPLNTGGTTVAAGRFSTARAGGVAGAAARAVLLRLRIARSGSKISRG
jgi:hypothetical protein